MPNTVVTSTTTAVTFTLSDKEVEHAQKVTIRKENILSVGLLDDRITVRTRTTEYNFSNKAGADTNRVDSVDGVAPANLLDLYNKLAALL